MSGLIADSMGSVISRVGSESCEQISACTSGLSVASIECDTLQKTHKHHIINIIIISIMIHVHHHFMGDSQMKITFGITLCYVIVG